MIASFRLINMCARAVCGFVDRISLATYKLRTYMTLHLRSCTKCRLMNIHNYTHIHTHEHILKCEIKCILLYAFIITGIKCMALITANVTASGKIFPHFPHAVPYEYPYFTVIISLLVE